MSKQDYQNPQIEFVAFLQGEDISMSDPIVEDGGDDKW